VDGDFYDLSYSMRRWTLGLAITGFVIAILMAVTLLVLWNVYIVQDYRTIHDLAQSVAQMRSQHFIHEPGARWAVLAMGCTFFAIIIVALSLYFTAYLTQRRFRSRQTEWLNQATHELKIPLANVQLFAQTIQKGHVSAQESQVFVGYILQETHRLQGLVNRILQARRVDSAAVKVRNRIEVGRMMAQVAKAQLFQVELRAPAEELWVRGDRVMLEATLENLLGNAMKYGDGSAPVLEARRQGGHVEIEVSDRGIGIPPRYRRDIFRRFFRTPLPEHKKREGTGLGLHIVRTTVRRHHGEIGVRDNPGGGSVFWIRLPLAKERKT